MFTVELRKSINGLQKFYHSYEFTLNKKAPICGAFFGFNVYKAYIIPGIPPPIPLISGAAGVS